jgi:hypothetical protein
MEMTTTRARDTARGRIVRTAVVAGALCVGVALAPTGVAAIQSAATAGTAVSVVAWPGSEPRAVDAPPLGRNISGVAFTAADRAWVVRDDPGELIELSRSGAAWVSQRALSLQLLDGGRPDAEAVTTAGGDSGVYVGVERSNDSASVSRNAVIRVEVSVTGARTTDEWNLTALLPTTSPNQGIEGLAHIPDDVLVASGLRTPDGAAYDPRSVPDHGSGLFVVALERTGDLAFVALPRTGEATLVSTLASGIDAAMDLAWVPAWRQLWVQCDSACSGRAAVWSFASGAITLRAVLEPPAAMRDRNLEGLAFSPSCASRRRTVLWAEDRSGDGSALRSAQLPCAGPAFGAARRAGR